MVELIQRIIKLKIESETRLSRKLLEILTFFLIAISRSLPFLSLCNGTIGNYLV